MVSQLTYVIDQSWLHPEQNLILWPKMWSKDFLKFWNWFPFTQNAQLHSSFLITESDKIESFYHKESTAENNWAIWHGIAFKCLRKILNTKTEIFWVFFSVWLSEKYTLHFPSNYMLLVSTLIKNLNFTTSRVSADLQRKKPFIHPFQKSNSAILRKYKFLWTVFLRTN